MIRALSCADEDEPTHLIAPQPVWQQPSGFMQNGSVASSSSRSNGRPAPTILIPPTKPYSSTPVSPHNTELHSPSGSSTTSKSSKSEVAVHASLNWRRAFALGGRSKSPKSAHSGEIEGWWEDPDDPVHPLNACAPTMQELWRDQNVRRRLQEKRLRLEESSGLYVSLPSSTLPVSPNPRTSYLDEIPRITAKKYIPTDGAYIEVYTEHWCH